MNKLRIVRTVTATLIVLSLIVPLFSISTAQACWWRKPLRGDMNLSLQARPAEPGEPGYDPDPEKNALRTWAGFISGDINGEMQFFLTNYIVEGENGEWGHFYEVWQIYDETGTTLLMEGYDEGYTHQPTGKYAMIGRVTYASHEFARWQGHVVFMYGTITPPPAEWGTNPELPVAPGKFIVF